MRIDSSGNVFIGKTSATISTDGLEFASGALGITRNDDTPLFLNRRSSDGSIQDFRKDNTTVGSIGSEGGNSLYILSGDTGLRFSDSANKILPVTTAGSARDNAITLGSSGARFADLFLGGGLYVGGTGSANYLDDYEEGTYTGVITDGGSWGTVTLNGDNTFHYTKIGRMVFVMGNANRNDSTGYTNNLQLSIPFTSSSTQNMNAPNGGVWLDGTGTDKVALVYVSNGQNYVLFKESGDSSDYVKTNAFQTGRPLYTSYFYFTDA